MRGQLEQFGNRFYVPVGVVGRGVAQIGRQLDHLVRRVFARAVPVDDRSRRKAVAEVVDARTTTMTTVLLRSAQTDPLTHQREVVAGTTISEPFAAAGDEEWLRRKAEQAVALSGIGSQALSDAFGERDEPLLAQFAAADAQHAFG